MFRSRNSAEKPSQHEGVNFVSNKFKRKFIIKFCIVLVLGALISGAIVYSMSKATVTTTFEGSRLKIISTADFILPVVLLSSAVVIVFVGVSAIIMAIFAYHGLEMSLGRVEAEIEKADAGDLHVDLDYHRKEHEGDEFTELAMSLDKLIHDFGRALSDIKNDVAALETDCARFEDEKQQKIPPRIKEELKRIKEDLRKFST